MRLFKPEVFQGNLRRKNYFEGWYFKQVTQDLSGVISIIPGVSLVENDAHAFIQIMDGSKGTTEYIRYPLDQFTWRKKELYVKIGSSIFDRNGIILDIRSEFTSLMGKVDFRNLASYPKSIISPGLWGGIHLSPLWNVTMVWCL